MLMPRRIALTVVVLAAASMAQVNTPASAIRMPHISFVSTRAMNVFTAIAHEYRVVIGVYGVLIGADNRTVTVNGNNVTLAQVLDDIVAQDTMAQAVVPRRSSNANVRRHIPRRSPWYCPSLLVLP